MKVFLLLFLILHLNCELNKRFILKRKFGITLNFLKEKLSKDNRAIRGLSFVLIEYMKDSGATFFGESDGYLWISRLGIELLCIEYINSVFGDLKRYKWKKDTLISKFHLKNSDFYLLHKLFYERYKISYSPEVEEIVHFDVSEFKTIKMDKNIIDSALQKYIFSINVYLKGSTIEDILYNFRSVYEVYFDWCRELIEQIKNELERKTNIGMALTWQFLLTGGIFLQNPVEVWFGVPKGEKGVFCMAVLGDLGEGICMEIYKEEELTDEEGIGHPLLYFNITNCYKVKNVIKKGYLELCKVKITEGYTEYNIGGSKYVRNW